MNNKVGNDRKHNNDSIFTPKHVAQLMIDMCDIKESDTVLDPSYGEVVFYNNLPNCNKDFCEIKLDKDFFDCNKTYDLIIGNPPYSMWNKWIEHTMKLTDKFCYIMGILNLSEKRLGKIHDNGFGLVRIHMLKIDWWFASSLICIFEKHKPSVITVSPNAFLCDVCGGRCKRGRSGNSHNSCTNI
jgi:hypothetical protein